MAPKVKLKCPKSPFWGIKMSQNVHFGGHFNGLLGPFFQGVQKIAFSDLKMHFGVSGLAGRGVCKSRWVFFGVGLLPSIYQKRQTGGECASRKCPLWKTCRSHSLGQISIEPGFGAYLGGPRTLLSGLLLDQKLRKSENQPPRPLKLNWHFPSQKKKKHPSPLTRISLWEWSFPAEKAPNSRRP